MNVCPLQGRKMLPHLLWNRNALLSKLGLSLFKVPCIPNSNGVDHQRERLSHANPRFVEKRKKRAVTQVCGAVTTNVTVAVCVVLPLVPVTVSVELPAATELLVVMVNVAEPGTFTELELNVAVTPSDAPLTLNTTVPLKPLIALTLTV